MTKEKMHQNAEERLELLHTISDIVGIEVEKRMHTFTDTDHFSVRDASMAKLASGTLSSEQDKKEPYMNNLSPQSVRNKRRDTNKRFINMKKLLLLCALLISVITLSGATNRSFRTEMEQWNPIGFTQATNGITQAQSDSPITNRLTAGSAILPTVATAAPSGVLRDGSSNVITFTTAKAVGERISLYMEYSGAAPTLSGATGKPYYGWTSYTLKSQTVTITGDVTFLNCSGNQLTALDVSQNTALTELDCFNNQIKGAEMTRLVNSLPDRTGKKAGSFFVVQEPYLEGNYCRKSDVAIAKSKNWNTLKYNSNTKEQVDYEGEEASITIKTNLKIGDKIVICMQYEGAAPMVSGATGTPESGKFITYTLITQTVTIRGDVTELYCSGNQLTTLDVSQNTELTELYCSHNQLTALDVSQNTELTTLYCYNNQLTALDVSKNTALTNLDCRGNQIKFEEMTRLVNSLPDRTGKEVGRFGVVQEPAPEGNICLKSDVAIAKSKNWKTQKYKSDTKEYVAYEGEEQIMSFTTAKKGGEKISLNMEYSGATPTLSGATGTPISGTEVTYTLTSPNVTIRGYVTVLSCNGNQLTTLDLSKNTALTELSCSNNQLTTLDVSKNTALTRLDCAENQLTALDVSKNIALLRLYCYNNQLTTLDVSKNIALIRLDCYNNQLKALDVSKNIALIRLDCYNNQLKALDVSKNSELGTLNCRGNQIKGEEMTRLVNSLPDRTGKEAGTFIVVQEPTPEGNRCLKTDVAIAKSKNWNTQKYNSDTDESVAYEGEEPIPYTVTLTKEGEGTLTATGAADLNAVPEGTELTIEATPAAGYELTALTANGTDILATNKFVVTAATEVKATFVKTYAVTFTKEGVGTLTATGAADFNAVPEGTELTIVATPAAGYELKALTANGADILATKKVVVTGATEVKATFAKKTAVDVVEAGSVRLYPNPASTYVNVRTAKADALVRLYDANGSLRYEACTDADGTLQIDLSACAEGTYLLRVGNDAQRLLIQR